MTLSGEFLDFDGLDTDVEIILYYKPIGNEANNLHVDYGVDYRDRLAGVFKGAVKQVVAQHQALALNREERDKAESSLTEILTPELGSIHQEFRRVEITDVDLPKGISDMIESAKIQDERNKLAEKKELEKKNLANAEIARAKGEYEAAVFDAKTKAVLSQPQMLRLKELENENLKWVGYVKHGTSPYGNNNIYGEGTGVIKGIK